MPTATTPPRRSRNWKPWSSAISTRIKRRVGVPPAFPIHQPWLFDMAATDFDVKYVAHLARISLSPAEEQKLGAQLGNILGYIEKLKELDVSQVEPTAHAVPLINVTRPDEVRPSLPTEEALRNAPAKA